MSRAMVIINTEWDRQKAVAWAGKAPWGTRIEFKAAKRTLDQNSLFWAILTDVASQVAHGGERYTTEEWKLLFMHAWGREVRFLPGLDQKSVVPVGQSSSDLSKQEMTDLIEFIFAWGAEHGVVFHEHIEPEPSDATVFPVASDDGRDVDPPADVAASNSNASDDTTPAIPDASDDSGSVAPATGDTAATPSADAADQAVGESETHGAVSSPAAEHECIEKMLRIVKDATDGQTTPREAAVILADSADMWLGLFSDERKPFVTAVFTTSKKVLRGELKPDAARRYLEGLAA